MCMVCKFFCGKAEPFFAVMCLDMLFFHLFIFLPSNQIFWSVHEFFFTSGLFISEMVYLEDFLMQLVIGQSRFPRQEFGQMNLLLTISLK